MFDFDFILEVLYQYVTILMSVPHGPSLSADNAHHYFDVIFC